MIYDASPEEQQPSIYSYQQSVSARPTSITIGNNVYLLCLHNHIILPRIPLAHGRRYDPCLLARAYRLRPAIQRSFIWRNKRVELKNPPNTKTLHLYDILIRIFYILFFLSYRDALVLVLSSDPCIMDVAYRTHADVSNLLLIRRLGLARIYLRCRSFYCHLEGPMIIAWSRLFTA